MHDCACSRIQTNTCVCAGVSVCSGDALSHTSKYENEFCFSDVSAGILTVPEY